MSENDQEEKPWDRNRRQYEEDKKVIFGLLERGQSFELTPQVASSLMRQLYNFQDFQQKLISLLAAIGTEGAQKAHEELLSTHNKSFMELNGLLTEIAGLAHERNDGSEEA